jgi:hypothetical protein
MLAELCLSGEAAHGATAQLPAALQLSSCADTNDADV